MIEYNTLNLITVCFIVFIIIIVIPIYIMNNISKKVNENIGRRSLEPVYMLGLSMVIIMMMKLVRHQRNIGVALFVMRRK